MNDPVFVLGWICRETQPVTSQFLHDEVIEPASQLAGAMGRASSLSIVTSMQRASHEFNAAHSTILYSFASGSPGRERFVRSLGESVSTCLKVPALPLLPQSPLSPSSSRLSKDSLRLAHF